VIERMRVEEPAGGWRNPWPQVFEIAHDLPADRWALVGGLMVQAHALAAGIQTTRVTLDVDVAVRIEAGAFSYSEAAAALTRLGYTLDDSQRLTYRFKRGSDVVDLMVPDHERPPPRHARRDIMAVAGGRQALDRLLTMHFQVGDSESAVPVPTLHGALVLKAAAHIADTRDADRHLLDAITLLACIIDSEAILSDLRGSDRKRLNHLIRAIDAHPLVTAQAPTDTARLAQRSLDELRAGMTSPTR
jgi:hypothetical protein